MKQNTTATSAQARAGERFMQRLKVDAPHTYRLFSQQMAANSGTGMGSMSDFWQSLGNAVTSVVQQAPQYYVDKEQAKRELDAAQKAAQMELRAAELELAARDREIQLALQQARIQQDQFLINENLRRQQEIAAQRSEIGTIMDNLTGGQKTGLMVAGGLAALLLFMQLGK